MYWTFKSKTDVGIWKVFLVHTCVAIRHSTTLVLNSEVAALFISTQLFEITKEIPSGR